MGLLLLSSDNKYQQAPSVGCRVSRGRTCARSRRRGGCPSASASTKQRSSIEHTKHCPSIGYYVLDIWSVLMTHQQAEHNWRAWIFTGTSWQSRSNENCSWTCFWFVMKNKFARHHITSWMCIWYSIWVQQRLCIRRRARERTWKYNNVACITVIRRCDNVRAYCMLDATEYGGT